MADPATDIERGLAGRLRWAALVLGSAMMIVGLACSLAISASKKSGRAPTISSLFLLQFFKNLWTFLAVTGGLSLSSCSSPGHAHSGQQAPQEPMEEYWSRGQEEASRAEVKQRQGHLQGKEALSEVTARSSWRQGLST